MEKTEDVQLETRVKQNPHISLFMENSNDIGELRSGEV